MLNNFFEYLDIYDTLEDKKGTIEESFYKIFAVIRRCQYGQLLSSYSFTGDLDNEMVVIRCISLRRCLMNILFTVHQFFPNHYTGTERLVLNLCKQMQRMGHRVKVLTYAVSENEGFSERCGVLIREYQYQGVPVIAVRHKTNSRTL